MNRLLLFRTNVALNKDTVLDCVITDAALSILPPTESYWVIWQQGNNIHGSGKTHQLKFSLVTSWLDSLGKQANIYLPGARAPEGPKQASGYKELRNGHIIQTLNSSQHNHRRHPSPTRNNSYSPNSTSLQASTMKHTIMLIVATALFAKSALGAPAPAPQTVVSSLSTVHEAPKAKLRALYPTVAD